MPFLSLDMQHWYKLGLQHLGRIGETFGKKWTHHPDQRAGAGSIAGASRLFEPRVASVTQGSFGEGERDRGQGIHAAA